MNEGLNNTASPIGEIQEAINYIELIESDVWAMGANDSEVSELRRLAEKVRDGSLSPIEARDQAKKIIDKKQDYH